MMLFLYGDVNILVYKTTTNKATCSCWVNSCSQFVLIGPKYLGSFLMDENIKGLKKIK